MKVKMKSFEVGDVIVGVECSYLITSILFGGTYVCLVSTGKIENRTASSLNQIQHRKINSWRR